MFVGLVFVLFLMMSSDTVEMIKHFRGEGVVCYSLSFHGDTVYIGGNDGAIQWNVDTDAVAKLLGYPQRLI
jgi:hypothetical protein